MKTKVESKGFEMDCSLFKSYKNGAKNRSLGLQSEIAATNLNQRMIIQSQKGTIPLLAFHGDRALRNLLLNQINAHGEAGRATGFLIEEAEYHR